MMTEHKPEPRLLDRVRESIRLRHYSLRTEEAYVHWIRRFILYHGKRHPAEMGHEEVRAFLSYLAQERTVSASTQNQALAALLFLYGKVLERPLEELREVERAKRRSRVPEVFTPDEARRVLAHLQGTHWLMASLLYGSGLRLLECLRLRVKDVDFGYRQLTVRDGKGGKDRVTMLPGSLEEPLRRQIEHAAALHAQDLREGYGSVYLPDALARKFPRAASELGWQYLFPSAKRSRDPRSGLERRHHLDEKTLQRAVHAAIRAAGVRKHASCHTFRHSFATHLLQAGYDIRTVQDLLGHRDVKMTMVSPMRCRRAPSA